MLMVGPILHLLRARAEEGGLVDELHYLPPHPVNRNGFDILICLSSKLYIRFNYRYFAKGRRQPNDPLGISHQVATTALTEQDRTACRPGLKRSLLSDDPLDAADGFHLEEGGVRSHQEVRDLHGCCRFCV